MRKRKKNRAQVQPPKVSLPPQMQDAYDKIVVAGMKVMYDPSMHDTLMRGLNQNAPPAQIAATEVAGVLRILDDKYKNQLPKEALYPAGMFLMLDLMKFMQEGGKAKFGDKDVMQASQLLLKVLLAEYHLLDQKSGQQPAQPGQQMPPQAQAMTPQPSGLISAGA